MAVDPIRPAADVRRDDKPPSIVRRVSNLFHGVEAGFLDGLRAPRCQVSAGVKDLHRLVKAELAYMLCDLHVPEEAVIPSFENRQVTPTSPVGSATRASDRETVARPIEISG